MLAISLSAVVVALLLMLSWGPSSSQQAEAGAAEGRAINATIQKNPRLANLWLCDVPGAPGCDNKESGVEQVNFDVNLSSPVNSMDPKCTGSPRFMTEEECVALGLVVHYHRVGSRTL